jgi:hypothetical protein
MNIHLRFSTLLFINKNIDFSTKAAYTTNTKLFCATAFLSEYTLGVKAIASYIYRCCISTLNNETSTFLTIPTIF